MSPEMEYPPLSRNETDPASDLHGGMTAIGSSSEVSRTAAELLPLFYQDVRRLARRGRRMLGAGETMQTTALINETYLKLRDVEAFHDRAHFLCAASQAMRHALVSYARERVAIKRGAGAAIIVPLEDAENIGGESDQVLIEINEALARLAALSPRLAQVVECRFFAGYSDEETALALNLTDRTVRRDWAKARTWLRRELGSEGFRPPA